MRPLVTAAILAAGCFALYSSRLDTTPVSLAQDEVTIAMTAHSISATGKDLFGRPWPLYFQMTEGSWFHPVIVYSIAIVLQLLPLSEFAIRLSTVVAGVANIVLLYFVGRVLFRREMPAVLAAVLLALTPAHFLHSRLALEYLYPLPFISAWLLCLFSHFERDDRRWLFASTSMLGLGFYSYIASVIVMPMYFVLTIVMLLLRGVSARTLGIAFTGFVIPLMVLFVPWSLRHQGAFGHTVGHYLIYDTGHLNALQGVRELLGRSSLVARTTTYWAYFDPAFLFLDAAAPFMYSTRTTGVFLLPFAVLLPVGLYQAIRSGDPARLLLVLGFLTAPVAAVIVGERGAIGRALELLPFGVLLVVVAAMYLWDGPRLALRRVLCLGGSAAGLVVGLGYAAWTLLTEGRISASTPFLVLVSLGAGVVGIVSDRTAGRMIVTASLVVAVAQFQQYLMDYFTDYRSRASESFRFNKRGGLEYLIERSGVDSVPVIYLKNFDRDGEAVKQYWRFYLVKHGREDLLARTVILGESEKLDVSTIPRNSAILARVSDPETSALTTEGALRLEKLVPEPGGRPFYAVLRR